MVNTFSYIWNHPLASKNRSLAFSRYFRWQLGSRLLKWPIEVPFVEKTFLVVERGMTGATGNIYCGLHEFSDMAFLLHFLRAGDCFVDVGANVGSYTVLAAGVTHAKVIALEPLPSTFRKLERNIRCNQLQDLVEAKCCAAGAASGNISFTADLDTMNRVVSDDYVGPKTVVPVKCLDELLEDRHPIMWKVDVEGFEPSVIAGAQKALADSGLLAVLLEGDQPEVIEAMMVNGFERAYYEPFSRELSTTSPQSSRHNNSLWVRGASLEQVRMRCKTAHSFQALSVTI